MMRWVVLEPDLLRSFVAVCEHASFSAAAVQLGITQPAVSQRVRRLEDQIGRRLLDRDTHGVTPTDSGDAMLGFARRILATSDEAQAYFAAPSVRGRVRFGSADDLALTHLPGILREFRRGHPHVTIDLTVGQSAALARQLKAGRLDLVYIRREPDVPDGTLVRREQLVWGAHASLQVEPTDTVPLVTYQPHSPSRVVALRALESADRNWRVVCAARDITGILAAVRAAVGVALFPVSMMPSDLAVLGPGSGLPPLESTDFALLANPGRSREPVEALSEAIIRHAAS